MQRRTKIWIGIALLMIFITLPVSAQVPPNGEHDYGGTADGDISGSITGTITTSGQEVRIREYTAYALSGNDTRGDESFNIDLTPYSLSGTVNTSQSKTLFIGTISCGFEGDSDSFCSIDVTVDGNSIDFLSSNCGGFFPLLHANGGMIEEGFSKGAGHSRATCTTPYQQGTKNVSIDYEETQITEATWSLEIRQIEIYNHTTPDSTLTGTFTGTYSGEERGQIEEINVTSNTTETENLSVSNFTFENIMGTLSVEELDFWIPIVFFTIIAWIAFNRDATMIGLSAILGILFVLTGMGAWSIAASLVLMSLGFTLEYLAKRVWRRKRKNME